MTRNYKLVGCLPFLSQSALWTISPKEPFKIIKEHCSTKHRKVKCFHRRNFWKRTRIKKNLNVFRIFVVSTFAWCNNLSMFENCSCSWIADTLLAMVIDNSATYLSLYGFLSSFTRKIIIHRIIHWCHELHACSLLSVSLQCPYLIAPSVFSNVYLHVIC